MGSYLHGMFENDEFRSNFLNQIGFESSDLNYSKNVDQSLNDFADFLEENINVSEIFDKAY